MKCICRDDLFAGDCPTECLVRHTLRDAVEAVKAADSSGVMYEADVIAAIEALGGER